MRNATLFLMALGAAGFLASATQAAETAKAEYSQAVRLRPDPERGAQLFRDCAVCHGANGNGAEDGGVPRIAGQHFRVIVRQIVDYRHDTRWDIRMEHFAGKRLLKDAQSIADVAAYATQLPGEAPHDMGDGSQISRGSMVYARRCTSCHGTSGEGDNENAIPHLAGQHYEYLTRQIYDALDGRRPNFSGAHLRSFAKLERDDIVGVADFLSRSEWTGVQPTATGPVNARP
jgi:cytochrome c553